MACSSSVSLFIFGCPFFMPFLSVELLPSFVSCWAWALSSTDSVSQLISCGCSWSCTCCANAGLSVFPRRTASWCSFALTVSARSVSPTYSSPQVLHFTEYMMWVVNSGGNLSFTQWMGLVVQGVKKALLTPAVRAMHRNSSLNRLTKGILALATPRSDSCSFPSSFQSGIFLRLDPFSMVFSTKCFR